MFLSGFSDVTISTVFSYQVVSETEKFLFRENSFFASLFVGADLKFSPEISRQKSFGKIGVVFCWALAGILFLARADDGIVVSGASVQAKPETTKGDFQKPQ